MSKKLITLTSGLALGAALILATFSASAETPLNSELPAIKPSPMSIQINRQGEARLEGTISSISGSTLVVTSWGGDWNVDASKAKVVRRFGGKSDLSEFQVGDAVMILGKVASGSWSITARTIKDNSIQERGALSGTISNLDATKQTFTLNTRGRGAVSVLIGTNTKIYFNRRAASFSDLAAGMAARVSGVFNTRQATISAVRVEARTTEKERGEKKSETEEKTNTNVNTNTNTSGSNTNTNS